MHDSKMSIRSRWILLVSWLGMLMLAACTSPTSDGPSIASMEMRPSSARANEPVTFSWAIEGDDDPSRCTLVIPDSGVDDVLLDPCGTSVTTTFSEPGTYMARFTVWDSQNRLVAVTIPVTIAEATSGNEPPAIDAWTASPRTAQTGQDITFTWAITEPEGDPISCRLSFDDGTRKTIDPCAETAGSYTHPGYATPGKYVATLYVDDGSQSVQKSTEVVVMAPDQVMVVVAPSNVQLTPGAETELTATVVGTADQGVTWSATSGTIEPTDNPTIYTAPMTEGDYLITATSLEDPTSTDSVTVSVVRDPNAAPVIDSLTVSPNPSETGQDVTFSWSIADPDGDAMSCVVSPGDDPANDVEIPCSEGQGSLTYRYDTGGTYTFALRVRDATLETTETGTIVVEPEPTATNRAPDIESLSVSPNPSEAGQEVTFTWNASDADGDGLRCELSHGDGTPDTVKSFCPRGESSSAHSYDAPGTYTAELRISDGTATTAKKINVTVEEAPVLGDEVWTDQFGSSNLDDGRDVAVDKWGNVVVAGYTNGTLEGSTAGKLDAFVQKYDSNGNVKWTDQFGTGSSDGAWSVAVDGSGNVLVAGYTFGNLADSTAGKRDAFVRKYDANGKLAWTDQFGSSEEDGAWGVAVDRFGNVLVAGYTDGEFGGSSAGRTDAFVRKYTATGTLAWTKLFGTSDWDYARDVAVDGSGNVLVVGYTGGNLGGSQAGSGDAYLRKYDPEGKEMWTVQFGTSDYDYAWGVAVDATGNVSVAGETTGSMEGANTGNYDAFVRQYDANGKLKWTDQFGTSEFDHAWGVAADGSGNVLVTGYTYGALEGLHIGNADAFLRKYNATGTEVWTDQFGTLSDDVGWGVAADGLGNVLVAGRTNGKLEGANYGGGDAFVRKILP